MAIHLYLAPAAAGKTAYVVDLVRRAARDLQVTPRVVVPTHLQARAFHRRLAQAGGAIGVRVLTFDQLVTECLDAAGEVYVALDDPVCYRLIRSIVDSLPLYHYAPLAGSPGLIQALGDVIKELKAGMIPAGQFVAAVAATGNEPRLGELALIYAAYQERLQANGWADREGRTWLAWEALRRNPDRLQEWGLLAVDGFDDLTPAQLALLGALAGRVQQMIVTLTGHIGGPERPLVHRRFRITRRRLEQALGVRATSMPAGDSGRVLPLAHLEATLFRSDASRVESADAVELVEAPDRATEVRVALRWLKARIVEDEMRPGEVALLARSVEPYRPFILQTAAEFGLPVRLVDGLPLRSNPAVAAILDLLRLMLPQDDDHATPVLSRRLVVEAWRSPYFDWSALPAVGATEPIGIQPGDAEVLNAVARWGRVIEGQEQWEEVLDDLASRPEEDSTVDDERGLPGRVPVGPAAEALRDKFRRFLQRLMPPQGDRSFREFIGWLETLIGSDPAFRSLRFPVVEHPTSLRVVVRARDAVPEVAERDVAALQALKDVLRGLVWAEQALGMDAVGFRRFFEELEGLIETAAYRLPARSDRDEILVADVTQARGIPFRAVAVLGLAEGEFPATLSEDPFLRDEDRMRFRDEFHLPLKLSTESAEAEYFYETITRPRERLLLTRPRLADNGAVWPPSPFWEEVRRLVRVAPRTLTSDTIVPPSRAASWPELMLSLARYAGQDSIHEWIERTAADRLRAVEAAAHILVHRARTGKASPFDGDLSGLGAVFAAMFTPDHRWSPSRLEAYRTCPFLFFVSTVLELEPRPDPVEGLDARQLGNIYHRIFEQVYRTAADPLDWEQLVAVLDDVAAQVLDEAPRREGFRETAWWSQTRREIEENVRRSLKALVELGEGFIPYQYEVPFGLRGRPPLVVVDGSGKDSFSLRGLIDRVDRTPDGRLRIIDYKTAGPASYGQVALRRGKKIQIPLYALAARDALRLGEPVEGFYWHVRTAEPSSFTLAKYGPEKAMHLAVEHAWEAVRGARSGWFAPRPPEDGCPSYCPAAAFCWHYRLRFGG